MAVHAGAVPAARGARRAAPWSAAGVALESGSRGRGLRLRGLLFLLVRRGAPDRARRATQLAGSCMVPARPCRPPRGGSEVRRGGLGCAARPGTALTGRRPLLSLEVRYLLGEGICGQPLRPWLALLVALLASSLPGLRPAAAPPAKTSAWMPVMAAWNACPPGASRTDGSEQHQHCLASSGASRQAQETDVSP
jgi:hypothetical protein